MSLLTMIGEVRKAMGYSAPTVVMASTDTMILELLAMANTSGQELVDVYDWQELQRQVTFTSTAAYDQGTFNDDIVTDGDFNRLVNNTLWNRSSIQQASGPITGVEWQQDQAFMAAAPFPKFRIWRGRLFIGPSVPVGTGSAGTAGDTWAFEYISNNWCQGVSGTGQSEWLADTDTGILDEKLMKLDIIWRWKASKSLEYADDLVTFQDSLNLRMGQTTGARSLYLGGANVIFPINVPEGNWPTS